MKKIHLALLAAIAGTFTAPAQDLYFTTYTGVGANSVFALDPVTGIVSPYYTFSGINPNGDHLNGIAVSSSGDVFVSDAGSGTIYKIAAGGGSASTIATVGSGTQGLAVNSSGNLNIAANGIIYQVTMAGAVTTLNSQGSGIDGITADSSGNVYAANYADGTSSYVSKIDSAGNLSILAYDGGVNDVAYYNGIVYDAALNASAINRINSANGSLSLFSSADNGEPYALAVAPATGRVFITDGSDIYSLKGDGSLDQTYVASADNDVNYMAFGPASVPEPGILALAGLGALGLRAFRRRK
jgi:MYXO-CTERM domain-containing protein